MIKKRNTSVKLKTPKKNKRSSHWRKVRNAYKKKHPRCACCGSKKKVEIHHIKPFHLRPDLELVKSNLISLCESKKTLNCHIIIGHGGNYQDVNPDCIKDAKHFHKLLTTWQIKKARK